VEVWELLIREQVRETLTNYSTAGDGGRLDDLVAQFTDDAVMEVTPNPPATGHAAIVEMLARLSTSLPPVRVPGQKQMVRHVTTNVHFRSLTPERVETTAYFVAMTASGPDHWGRYFDVLVPVDGRWLFAHRVAKTEGWDPEAWHARNRAAAAASA
jgi:hypothetical protein